LTAQFRGSQSTKAAFEPQMRCNNFKQLRYMKATKDG